MGKSNFEKAWAKGVSYTLFTPCVAADSLLEALTDAANAALGDVVLLSPNCSSVDQSGFIHV
jgi:UDP-N-acetylmuramoylalanine-D-glutamate ligase